MVIDELIVILGLDATKFTAGQRDALEAFRKTKAGAGEFAKTIEEQGTKLADVFGMVKRGVLGMVAGFAGNAAAQFVGQVSSMDAATGRWAKTIGLSVDGLSKWQGMVRQVGGDATSATSTLSALQQQIESVRQGGGMFEGGFAALMNTAGVSIRDDADTSLRKIQKYLAGQVETGKMRPEEATTWMRRVPGMNQDMLNLLLKSTKGFEDLAAAIEKVGAATKESADAGAALQSSWDKLWQALEQKARKIGTAFAPAGVDMMDTVTRDLSTKKEFGKGFRETPWSAYWDAIKDGFSWRSSSSGTPPAGAAGGKTRGDRNNNPGNIEDGPFARKHGAIGTDGRFAIFPDRASGESAMGELLAKNYQGLTLAQIQRKWVGNEDPSYLGSMSGATGLRPGDVPNLQDPTVRKLLMAGMSRGEGTYLGAKSAAASRNINNSRGNTSTSTHETHIGQINVNAPKATDAEGVAKEIGPAMKRSAIAAPANTGLL